MKSKELIRFGIVGGGLMGREIASAAARWCHLLDLNFTPVITAVCSRTSKSLQWFEDNIPTLDYTTTDLQKILEDPKIDAIYCAVPHHLHKDIYIKIIKAGKHLLGEKPFGIDLEANLSIVNTVKAYPQVLVRCASQFAYYPGAYRIAQWLCENRIGKIIDVEVGFWHSSDLNPLKPINWKRKIETNGKYGCMGDLGMHVLFIPFRFGWVPKSVYAILSNIIEQRPDQNGNLVACDTYDNAYLTTLVETKDLIFPFTISTKRIAPGHANTWFIKINGTKFSIEYSTQNPKCLKFLSYQENHEQAWQYIDIPHQSAYPTITGSIFEFGFSDAILQMLAAFCDELINGKESKQFLHCVLPEETTFSHQLFTAAIRSYEENRVITI